MKTVLITGCSSGFGLEIARHFLARDWRVVATMRKPGDDVLPPSERLRVLPLDVTNADSIRTAIEAAGPIDVLVNNAGFGAAAPAELTPLDTVRALFDTNTIGTIAMTQAVLPQFRARGAGVVVNVTSSVTLKALPLVSAYRASKAAVNAFTESMAVELEPFGVRAHLVLPGRAPDTRFADNARANMHGFDHEAYAEFVGQAVARMLDASGPITHAQDVAEAVWRAATDPSSPLRLPAGADAEAWAAQAA
ncbi:MULTISPECIES: SDR family oxidoreductase [Burkholderia]|jgi:NAD(P)-dependent dehydrogenase (short-subunit alcohol dehydrogenase family)|uniref:Short-chain dehydrogenase/reductase n=3 Tax=Pseudomonadota TaxID=1224 RepID=A0A1V2VYJ1_9BURK|nr:MULTISPECIES: SDR family oxidoreductase [Burkholderia]KIS50119.1 rmlD substrate binding domain protein [Burkholderia cepacia]AOK38832.1 dehydrogenase [Burkholderia cenocepacia]ARF89345.1 short-chain dehydrogenase/reductase SDR [Burkholderia cenocepacia]EPZ87701.1 NAD(P)H-binding protein, PF13460 family [Burkholderia cenocepacia K56-2Valvano]ERI32389.1 NAD(P)H-binding protein, PF13460 family [Burkholderia cenocepacia BC7]